MRLQANLLTGAALSMLLSVLCVYPATANENSELLAQSNNTSQMNNSQTITGTIRSFNGNVVRLELADGTTRDVTISSADRQRLSLEPGMRIAVTMMNDGMTSVALADDSNSTTASSTTSTTSSASRYNTANTNVVVDDRNMPATVVTVTGDIVTLRMDDGRTRDITLTKEAIESLNLRPGSRVIATNTNGRTTVALAPNIQVGTSTTTTTSTQNSTLGTTGINGSTTSTNTTSGQTTGEMTPVERARAEAQTGVTERTRIVQQRSITETETQAADTEDTDTVTAPAATNQPVQGLW